MFTDIRNLVERRRNNENDEGGFTLIELLIVIVVLGILAAIVVFAVQNLTGDSAKVACKADGKTVETALEAQRAQAPLTTNNGYVTDINALVPTYVRSVPNSNKYKIVLSAPTGTPTNPDAGGAVTDFSAGKVLVGVGATPTTFIDLNRPAAVGGNPCNAVL